MGVKNFPKPVIDHLKNWLRENLTDPVPKGAALVQLACETNLTEIQVFIWNYSPRFETTKISLYRFTIGS